MPSEMLPARRPPATYCRPSLRPVPPKEPGPGCRPPGCSGQLRLPVRVGDRLPWPPEPEPPVLPPPPSEEDLRALLGALVEVTGGHRPLDSLRPRLSGSLLRRLRGRPVTPLGQRFVVQSLHIDDARPAVREVCATVEALPHGRLFAVAGRLEGYWHGWPLTAFGVVLPKQPAATLAA